MATFWRWLLSWFGMGKVDPIPVYIVQEPDPTPQPPKVIGRGTLNANFLALAPDWEMGDDRYADCGLFYPRFDFNKRKRFREE